MSPPVCCKTSVPDYADSLYAMLTIAADILILGGGASGLLAAYAAAREGASVIVLEKMPRPGRKIMITGKGRCNFTNVKPWDAFSRHIRTKANFLRPAFYNLPPEVMLDFLEAQRLPVVVEHGDRAFPSSYKASDVVDALVGAARRAGAQIQTEAEVTDVLRDPADGSFVVSCRDGRTFSGLRLVVATGGLSYPRTGSTGDGYRWARQSGHRLVECFPSLTALVPKGYKLTEVAPTVGQVAAKVLSGYDPGQARKATPWQEEAPVLPPGYPQPAGHLDRALPLSDFGRSLCGIHLRNVALTLVVNGNEVRSETGELDFTDGGIEGPVGFALSRDAVKAIVNGGKVRLLLDLKPGVPPEELQARLKSLWAEIQKDPRSRSGTIRSLLKVLLGKLMPWELVAPFLQSAPAILSGRKDNVRIDFSALAQALTAWPFDVAGFVGYERCVVTAGGVSTDDVLPKTLESRLVKGMYFCGEVLDIDADTGGYNLQCAFSTGYLAGLSAAKSL